MAVTAARTVGDPDRAGRVRRLPLLRPHLHHRLLPAPDRAAADRLARLPAAGQRRPSDRRHRPAGQRRRPAGRRRRAAPARPRRPPAAARAPHAVCDRVQNIYGIRTTVDGAWYRCCGGKVRKLVDCCSRNNTRINGDAALTGYCYARPQGLLRPVLRHAGALLSVGPLRSRLGGRRPADRRDRDVLALRVLGDRDDRPHRPHRRPADDDRRLRRLPARGGRRRAAHLRLPRCARRAAARRGRPGRLPRRRRDRAASRPSLEARGTRIVPQIRRQLPEHWRRVMPMPLAAALYGVLLGIGFTTFVLSFGVWALAGISLAVGDPAARPAARASASASGARSRSSRWRRSPGGPAGIRATELMCEQPGVYLGLRRGDAAALAVAALALVIVPGSAGRRRTSRPARHRPSATADALVFQRLGGAAVLRAGAAGGRPARAATRRSAGPTSRRSRGTRSSSSTAARSRRSRDPGARSRRDRGLGRLARLPSARGGGGDAHLHPPHREPGGARRRSSSLAGSAAPGSSAARARRRRPCSTRSRRPAAAASSSGRWAPEAAARWSAPAGCCSSTPRSRGALRLRANRRAPQPADGARAAAAAARARSSHGAPRERTGLVHRAHRASRLRRPLRRAPQARRHDRQGRRARASGPPARRRAAAATRAPALGRGERPQRRLGVAHRPVERPARLREQPALAAPLEVDHVLLDRGYSRSAKRWVTVAVTRARPRAVDRDRVELDDPRAPPGRGAAAGGVADRGRQRGGAPAAVASAARSAQRARDEQRADAPAVVAR